MAKLDLTIFDDLLPPEMRPKRKAEKSSVDLSDLLPTPPEEKLSPPLELLITWTEQKCKCGCSYEHPSRPPMTKHRLLRSKGFGWSELGFIYIHIDPKDVPSDIPVKIEVSRESLLICPACAIQAQLQSDLFPPKREAKDYLAIWHAMHQTARREELLESALSLASRDLDPSEKHKLASKDFLDEHLASALENSTHNHQPDILRTYWEAWVGGGTVDPEPNRD